MPKTFHIQELEAFFGNHPSFSIDELYQFYKKDEPKLKRSTLRWRIHQLVAKGLLQRVKRGVYTLEANEKEWNPDVTTRLQNVDTTIQSEFPYLTYSVWSTRWLVSSMHHLPGGYLTIVETEKEAVEAVFHFISETLEGSILVNPSAKEMNMYVDWQNDNIIVKNLISQSPLIEIDGIQMPRLEKIITDLFSDEVVFQAFQGHELKTIIQNLFSNYRINEGTLKRYAKRRNKWTKLKAALKRWNLSNHLAENT